MGQDYASFPHGNILNVFITPLELCPSFLDFSVDVACCSERLRVTLDAMFSGRNVDFFGYLECPVLSAIPMSVRRNRPPTRH